MSEESETCQECAAYYRRLCEIVPGTKGKVAEMLGCGRATVFARCGGKAPITGEAWRALAFLVFESTAFPPEMGECPDCGSPVYSVA